MKLQHCPTLDTARKPRTTSLLSFKWRSHILSLIKAAYPDVEMRLQYRIQQRLDLWIHLPRPFIRMIIRKAKIKFVPSDTTLIGSMSRLRAGSLGRRLVRPSLIMIVFLAVAVAVALVGSGRQVDTWPEGRVVIRVSLHQG